MVPKCIQQIEQSLVAYYDFAPPMFSYSPFFTNLAGNTGVGSLFLNRL